MVKPFEHSIGRHIIGGCVGMARSDGLRQRSKGMTLKLTSTVTRDGWGRTEANKP